MGIAELKKQLSEAIRSHVRGQVDQWRRIPRLALKADGRGGWSPQYSMAYRHGFWDVTGRLGIYVDLSDGELVSLSSFASEPASDTTVIAFIEKLENLSAAEIIASIETATTRPMHQPDKYEQNVSHILRWTGMGQLYEAANRKAFPEFGVIF